MVTTAKNAASAGGQHSAKEGDEGNSMAKHLNEAFAELDEHYKALPDARKPVKKIEAAIKGVYDVLEKRGYSRKEAKFLYDNRNMKKRFTPEFLLTVNSYHKATGGQGDLFDTTALAKH